MDAVVIDEASGLVPAEHVVRRSLDLSEHGSFRSEGHVLLHEIFTDDFRRALAAEAADRWSCAIAPEGGYRPKVVASAPTRQTLERDAPLLASLHHALVGVARALTGRMLAAAYAVYNYYEVTDAVWLHVDTEGCDLTMLATALGEVGPLYLHHDRAGASIEDCLAWEADPAWDPRGGVPFAYPERGVLAMRGSTIPHHRPGRPVSGLSAVAALHYRSMF